MIRRVCLLWALFSPALACRAQTWLNSTPRENNLQYGMTIKASLLFDLRNHHPEPYFRLGIDAGVGSAFIANWLYPTVNLELDIYNGGLGTRNRSGYYYGWDRDLIPAFTLTGGGPNHFRRGMDPNRYDNLYYFANFARPALQNPYDYSFSFGTLWCFSSDTAKKTQRIGFLDFNIAGRVQFSYYNDGAAPFSFTNLGDSYDRYHTGGGMLSYNGPRNTLLNTIELSYHKFTGFTQSSFEASNKMYFAFMDYHDPQQQFFNRSLFDLVLANPFRGYGLQIENYNSVAWDLQHAIHTTVLDTYHMVPYPEYFTIGVTYYGAYQQTGLR
jgi:hypothetical protein